MPDSGGPHLVVFKVAIPVGGLRPVRDGPYVPAQAA